MPIIVYICPGCDFNNGFTIAHSRCSNCGWPEGTVLTEEFSDDILGSSDEGTVPENSPIEGN